MLQAVLFDFDGVILDTSAGIPAIAVTCTNIKHYNFSQASLVVKTLEEVNIEKIKKLIK